MGWDLQHRPNDFQYLEVKVAGSGVKQTAALCNRVSDAEQAGIWSFGQALLGGGEEEEVQGVVPLQFSYSQSQLKFTSCQPPATRSSLLRGSWPPHCIVPAQSNRVRDLCLT